MWISALVLVLTGCIPGSANSGDIDPEGNNVDVLDPAGDEDGDGLTNAEELEHGADPLLWDTDGDTYGDGDEIFEGTDPADAESRIYIGYWPYYRAKTELADPGFGGTFAIGDSVGNQVGKDQFGDRVNLYDFAAEGTDYDLILIDVSAVWCVPCNYTSEWLATGADTMGFEGPFGAVREAVDAGTVQWVTVLPQAADHGPASPQDIREWDEAYPHENVPVILDKEGDFVAGLINYTGFWPSAMVVDAQTMEILSMGGVPDALADVLAEL